ncbi:MAG: type IX secretion system membrane protein PorP/SprF [Elusimicrobiota bacterium]
MYRVLKTWLFAVVVLSFTITTCNAAFTEFATSVRAVGLGGSACGLTGDVNNVFGNPAGIFGLVTSQAGVAFYQIAPGVEGGAVTQGMVAFGMPLKAAGITIAGRWLNMSVSGMYAEDTMGIAAAKSVNDKLTVGVEVKLLKASYKGDEVANDVYFSAGTEAQGVALDAGAVFKAMSNIDIGISLKNVNQPNIAINSSAENKAPMIIRAGMAYRLPQKSPGFVTADIVMNPTEGTEISAGIEKNVFMKQLNVRGGVNYIMDTQSSLNCSAGAGFAFGQMEANYAYVFQVMGGLVSYQNHYVGMNFKF